MSHADDLRAATDAATEVWVESLVGPLREGLVVAEASVEQLRLTVAARDARIGGLEAERADLVARVTELEAHVCPVVVEPSPGPDPIPSPWRLIEDVDLSDPRGWVSETGKPNNAEGYDLPRNVVFGPDGLRLVGKRETYQGHQFTAADTKGTGHPIPNHCRVEVVARAVHEVGLWPCVLWLRPLSGSDGEIDLMENFGAQARAAATLHNQYGTGHKMIHGNVPWRDIPGTPDGFHTYVMDKTPGRIVITVDGIVMMDVGPASPKPTSDVPDGFDWQRIFETDRQWYPRVTMQVSSPGKATGVPVADFREADLLVTSLRIYAPA